MSENNMAVIQFLGYRLVNIHYNCAPEFEFPEGDVAYNFNFSKSNMLLSSNDFQENLEVNVFYSQDGDIANATYKLTVEIAGRFVCNGEWEAKWETNAIVEDQEQKLVNAICEVYQNDDKLIEMSEKSQRYVREKFSTEAVWDIVKEDFE